MRALRTTIIVLAITAGIYTGVDYLVGIWHRHHLDMSFLQGSPAYRGQPYATEDFIREKALEPGQWVMTGSVVTTKFARPGSRYRFELDALEPVEMTVV